MRGDSTAVDWYRDRIQEKRRRATTLTIDIGLQAQDRDDTGTLSLAMAGLDSAIRILEQADAIVRAVSNEDELMDDLGHSMEPFDFVGTQARDEALRFFD